MYIHPILGIGMRIFMTSVFSALAFSVVGATAVQSKDLTEAASFNMPKIINEVELEYPEEALEDLIEGFVFVEITIGADGTVSSAKTVGGFNTEIFAPTAINALMSARFAPATYQDVSVEAETHLAVIPFIIPRPDVLIGASDKYRRSTYKKARRLYKAEKYEKAKTVLIKEAQSNTKHLYDYAFNHYFLSVLERKLGNEKASLKHLQFATTRDLRLLDDDTVIRALKRRLALELKFGYLPDALLTVQEIRDYSFREIDPALNDQAYEIEQRLEAGNPIVAAIEIPHTGLDDAEVGEDIGVGTDHFLLGFPQTRSRLKIRYLEGELEAAWIRCTAKTYELTVKEDPTWELPANLGECRLWLAGEPGLSAEVIQWPDSTDQRWAHDGDGELRVLTAPEWQNNG